MTGEEGKIQTFLGEPERPKVLHFASEFADPSKRRIARLGVPASRLQNLGSTRESLLDNPNLLIAARK